MNKFVSLAVVVVAILVGAALADTNFEETQALADKVESIIEKCNTTIGALQMDEVNSIYEGTLKGKTACFISCIAKGLDLFKANNIVDKEKLKNLLKPIEDDLKHRKLGVLILSKIHEIIDGCLANQQGGSDACAVTKNIVECAASEAIKFGLISVPL